MFHYFAVLYAVRYTEIVSFTEWGLIMALSSAFYLFALPLAGFVERFGLASPYAFLIFLEGVAALIFLLNEKPALFVSMILLNICGALTYAIERSVVARITEQLMRGRAETFMNLSFYSGMALGSYIGGLVYTWYPPFFIILTSTLLTIGAVFGFVIFRGLKQG
jgi:predicted MFS family arabinose efflux permease